MISYLNLAQLYQYLSHGDRIRRCGYAYFRQQVSICEHNGTTLFLTSRYRFSSGSAAATTTTAASGSAKAASSGTASFTGGATSSTSSTKPNDASSNRGSVLVVAGVMGLVGAVLF